MVTDVMERADVGRAKVNEGSSEEENGKGCDDLSRGVGVGWGWRYSNGVERAKGGECSRGVGVGIGGVSGAGVVDERFGDGERMQAVVMGAVGDWGVAAAEYAGTWCV